MCNSLAIMCEFCLAIFAYSFVITFKLSKQHSIFEEKVYIMSEEEYNLFFLLNEKIVSNSTLHVYVNRL